MVSPTGPVGAADLDRVDLARAVLSQVVDPEIPVLTIEDMGILRRVEVDGDRVEVDITPTYSGCPAMDLIRRQVSEALTSAGFVPVIETVLAPAWTTDWMSDAARDKLAAVGIAPPRNTDHGADEPVRCPRCRGAARTVSEFGATACKALMVCESCGEPFDRFKEI